VHKVGNKIERLQILICNNKNDRQSRTPVH